MERSGESAHTSRQLLEMADLNEGRLCLIAPAQIGKRAAQQGELR